MKTLNGKVGIVTGASKGMGRAFTEGLVEAGARVGCLARPSSQLSSLTEQLGDQILTIEGDVSDVETVERAVASTVERFGQLDFIVNNAAVFHPFPLDEATHEQILTHMGTNLMGPIWLARSAIPHLRRTKGHIVSISTESVRMPFPFLSIYSVSKAGLEMLSTSLREELREDGIRVTTLRSGQVAGSSGTDAIDPDMRSRFLETINRTGHAAFAGGEASPQSMTEALVMALTLPADINVDFLEVRATATM